MLEVGRVQVEPQHAPRRRRARAHEQRRESRRLSARRGPEAQRGGDRRRPVRPPEPQQRRPPVEGLRERERSAGGVRVAGRDEPARLERPRCARVRRPASTAATVSSASSPGNSAAAPPCQARSGRRSGPGGRTRRCCSPCWAIASPRSRQSSSHAASSGRRWKNGCSVGRRDHEQRHAVDAEVVEPVADQRAALEGRGLDVVQRDGERAAVDAHGTGRSRASGPARLQRAQRASSASGSARREARRGDDVGLARRGRARSRPAAPPGRPARTCARAAPSSRADGAVAHATVAAPLAAGLEGDEAERLELARHHDAARAGGRRARARRGRARTGSIRTRSGEPEPAHPRGDGALGRARRRRATAATAPRERRGRLEQLEHALLARRAARRRARGRRARRPGAGGTRGPGRSAAAASRGGRCRPRVAGGHHRVDAARRRGAARTGTPALVERPWGRAARRRRARPSRGGPSRRRRQARAPSA